MNALSDNPLETELEVPPALHLAFALGWASASDGVLPQIPELIAQWLQAPKVDLVLTNGDGDPHHEFTYEQPTTADQPRLMSETAAYQAQRSLGRHLKMNLAVYTEPGLALMPAQSRALDQFMALLQPALQCSLVLQHDRNVLGQHFELLSDREWEVCGGLEGSQSEKVIAERLGCSRHTLHTYVKCVYRKMKCQSRMELLSLLEKARQDLRRQTLSALLQGGMDGI